MSTVMAESGSIRHSTAVSRNIGLDAARLLASLLVLEAHCVAVFLPMFGVPVPVTALMGGIFGVELFFVLSGFLIGHLLFQVAETDATPRGWLVFMVRRWMRTLPVYYMWMAVVLLVLPAPEHLGSTLLRYATMTQNLAWPMPSQEWFNQSWTLAVEEWFYLLFSAALLATVAFTRSRHAIWAVILVFLTLPALVRILLPAPTDYEHQFYHVALLRMDAIAYGVALARLRAMGSALFRYPALTLSAGLTIVLCSLEQHVYGPWIRVDYIQYHLGQLFLASVGLSLFLVGISALRLRFRPLVWLITTGSQVSYGLYLMHLTIIEVVIWKSNVYGFGRWTTVAICAVLVSLLPYVSYRLFEAPIMALRPKQVRAVRAIALAPVTVP